MILDQIKNKLEYLKLVGYDKLYSLTKDKRFYRYLDETPVRNMELSLLWLDKSERFNSSIPWDEEKQGNEWFLLTDAQSRFNTAKAARIKFHSPDYFKIGKYYGIQHWNLSKEEKQALITFLKEPYSKKLNNWQFLIHEYNNVHGDDETIIIPLDLPLPDYLQLPEN